MLAAGAEAEVKKATAALDRKNNKLKDDERRESVAVDHMKVSPTPPTRRRASLASAL